MNTADAKRCDGRPQAEDRFAKMIRRDAAVMAYQQRQLDDEAAKIAGLRALRIARDSHDAARRRAAFMKAGPARGARATIAVKVPRRASSNSTR
jgi:hypothetical protein